MQQFMNMFRNTVQTPYIVMVGDVGTGKSTIVEKLTGEHDRSGSQSTSMTATAEPFWSYDGSMVIADTPGCNAMDNRMEQSQWVAGAISFMPVSKVFIIVKAEVRIDTVISTLRSYSDQLMELPEHLIGVLVTHMDAVTYPNHEVKAAITRKYGIEDIVCTYLGEDRDQLLNNIRTVSQKNKPEKVEVDSNLFLKLFDISEGNRRTITYINRCVETFKNVKKSFDEVRATYTGKELVDLLFEFQAWMLEEIEVMQKKMCEDLGFDFMSASSDMEAGYCALLTNQLRVVMYGIRVETEQFAVSGHGVIEARECPYCKLVWMKIEGCEGNTSCGNRPSSNFLMDLRDSKFAEVGLYSFRWCNGRLQVQSAGKKKLAREQAGGKFGCGKSINWSKMKPVDTSVLTADAHGATKLDEVAMLPNTHNAEWYGEKLSGDINAKKRSMHLGQRPNSRQ